MCLVTYVGPNGCGPRPQLWDSRDLQGPVVFEGSPGGIFEPIPRDAIKQWNQKQRVRGVHSSCRHAIRDPVNSALSPLERPLLCLRGLVMNCGKANPKASTSVSNPSSFSLVTNSFIVADHVLRIFSCRRPSCRMRP